jgi:phosphoglycolate phosphatase
MSMKHRFDLIVFDWDGTLADSARTIVEALQAASVDAGLEPPDDNVARSVIGLGLKEALHTLFPHADQAQALALVERYRNYYHLWDSDVSLFHGVAEAIPELETQGFLLAVATGKGRNGLNRSFEATGLKPYFRASRCADECFSKPHPQMLHELMNELGVLPERTLMIGDAPFDLQMAQNAGVSSLGATYGAQPVEKLLPYAPLACFDSFTKLRLWLSLNA